MISILVLMLMLFQPRVDDFQLCVDVDVMSSMC
jgi:hypothetical protein